MGLIFGIMCLVVTTLTEWAKDKIHFKGFAITGLWTEATSFTIGILTGLVYKPLAGWFTVIPDGQYSVGQYVCVGIAAAAVVSGVWKAKRSLEPTPK